MDDPKVSVCMITYNQERYIGQAVQSVLDQQTSFPIEIVIGEDCSTDGTRGVVEEFAHRHPRIIRPLLADANMGCKRNFMRTFAACRGQYVNILEGDDYWICPQKLQRQVEALEARPDWAICFHPTQVIYEDWRKAPVQWPENWVKQEASLVDLIPSNFIPTTAALFRNRLFGAFPQWFAKLMISDWPLHILNAEHGNIGFLPQAMSVYRVHSKGLWSTKDTAQKWRELLNTMSIVDHHFKGRFAAIIQDVRIQILNQAIEDARSAKVELVSLKEICERLAVENLSHRQAMNRSLAHRLAREAARPVKQLWSRLATRHELPKPIPKAA